MRANVVPIILHKNFTLEQIEAKENLVHNKICKRVMLQSIRQGEISKKKNVVVITSNELYYLKLKKKNRTKNK